MVPGRHPENPWSLFGLKAALLAQGGGSVDTEVADVSARLDAQLAKVKSMVHAQNGAGGTEDESGCGGTFAVTASCACAGRPIVGEIDPAVASSL
jgi:hypothetical protein